MLRNKKLIISIVLLILTVAIATGTTVAYLTASTGSVENVFTIGDVEITLAETTGVDYSMIPGKTIKKDPVVTVIGESEDAWIYIEAIKSREFDDYLSFEIADGWHELDGHPGVYYRSYVKAIGDTYFDVIKDNAVIVSDSLTEEKMSDFATVPKLSFKAYAIQDHDIDSALRGWLLLREEAER